MSVFQGAELALHVSSYRLQERLRLVEAIKLFILHHQEMSSVNDYSLQTNKGTQQSGKEEEEEEERVAHWGSHSR